MPSGEGQPSTRRSLWPTCRSTTGPKIEGTGGEAVLVTAEVSDPVDVRTLVSKTIDAFGRLDCAANRASIGGANAPTADYPEEDWN